MVCFSPQRNQLEQLCMNLCAETIQHFYNTHIFKSTMQALRDEDIQTEVEVRYLDNEPILELLTSQVWSSRCMFKIHVNVCVIY
jgi:myosin heavy subunit